MKKKKIYISITCSLDTKWQVALDEMLSSAMSLSSSIYEPQPSIIIKKNHHHNIQKKTFESLFQCPTIKYSNANNNNKFRVYSHMSVSSAYQVLDVTPDCSLSDLKAAFRAKVCFYSCFFVTNCCKSFMLSCFFIGEAISSWYKKERWWS